MPPRRRPVPRTSRDSSRPTCHVLLIVAFLVGLVFGSVVATLTSYAILVTPEGVERVQSLLVCD